VWNLLKELHAQGKLTPPQAALCAPTMPEEELYDMETDPHEIRNLAKSPEHEETLKRMRAAVEKWISDSSDQGKTLEPPEVAAAAGRTKPAAPDAPKAKKAGAGGAKKAGGSP